MDLVYLAVTNICLHALLEFGFPQCPYFTFESTTVYVKSIFYADLIYPILYNGELDQDYGGIVNDTTLSSMES